MSSSQLRQEFETWFLSLDMDFTKDDLTTLTARPEKYFFTTTQALWEQWQEIAELKEAIESMRGDA